MSTRKGFLLEDGQYFEIASLLSAKIMKYHLIYDIVSYMIQHRNINRGSK